MAPDNNRNIHPMETTATKQTSPPSRKRNRDDTSRIDPTDNNNEKTTTPAAAAATSTTSTATTWVPTIHRGEHASKDSVPIGDAIAEAFAKHQAVYLPHYYNRSSSTQQQQQEQQQQQGSRDELQWKDLSKIYESLEDSDKKSFCIENGVAIGSGGGSGDSSVESNDNNRDDNDGKQDPSVPGSSFLSDSGTPTHPAGYCSFLVQNDEKALAAILERLPVTDPVARATPDSHVSSDHHGWGYEPCLWIFFGRNPNRGGGTAEDLQGRPEHTDQISHDGTWHYQLSGTKRWLLRPTPMLLRQWKRDEEENENKNKNTDKNENENETKETATENDSKDGIDGENDNDDDDELPPQLCIDCHQGDVLIVNTRLWRHQTVLPPQPDPSVSYARDFWIGGVPPNTKTAPNDGPLYAASASASGAAMTNVDGLYAMDDIEEDTVLFREDDMPDCELHRSKDNANCKVVLLEDGLQAVVSARDIKAGEFFCIPDETDDDDDDDQEDYEEGCEDDNEEDYEGSSGEDQDEADEE